MFPTMYELFAILISVGLPLAIVSLVGYFVVKFAVKNGVKEALRERDEEKAERS